MKLPIHLSLLIAVGFTTTIGCADVLATPMNAKPLPHERPAKDFGSDEGEMTPPVSRFKHRRDYRIEEKEKAEQEAAAREQAIAAEEKAKQAALLSVKEKEQASINANNRGVALGQQKRWVEAISAHEEAVQLDPRSKQFRINLSAARCAYGQEKLQQGDLNSAASLVRKALVAAPDNGLAAKLLVETLKKQGRDPNNADVRMEIGDQLTAIGDLEGASVEYQAAMQLQPNARTYTKMGDIAMRYGQVSTALNWYREAIAKDGNYGAAHRQIAMVALNQRDYTTAAASLRKAIVCDPNDALAGETLVGLWRRQVATNPLLAENHLGLAGALQLTNQFADAENEYRKLEALDPHNPHLEAGRASLQRAIQHAEAEKYKAAAETLFNQGLQREALAEIGRAVSMEPRNAKYQFMFAQCLEANGDYQNAHQAYLTCVLLDPNNSEAAARIREMRHALEGKVNFGGPVAMPVQQQAAPMQQQAAPVQAVAPAAPQAPTAVSNSQSSAQTPAVSQNDAAQRALQDALARVTDLEAQKHYDDAVDLLKQIVAHNLQNAEMHHRLAVDMLANGSTTEAISEFRLACALRPDKSDYAADLAQAMAIHKRAMTGGAAASVAATPEVSK